MDFGENKSLKETAYFYLRYYVPIFFLKVGIAGMRLLKSPKS